MTTKLQLQANRLNAQKSTGPKTEEGSANSKMNALKHGLTAKQVTLLDEKSEDFEAFYGHMINALCPVGALEEQLVERIVVCTWRLRRVYRIEAQLFAAAEPYVERGERNKFEAKFARTYSEVPLEDRPYH